MVEIPDSLCSLFCATVEHRNGSYVIDVPPEAVTHDTVTPGDTYRIAVFTQDTSSQTSERRAPASRRTVRAVPVQTGPTRRGGGIDPTAFYNVEQTTG